MSYQCDIEARPGHLQIAVQLVAIDGWTAVPVLLGGQYWDESELTDACADIRIHIGS